MTFVAIKNLRIVNGFSYYCGDVMETALWYGMKTERTQGRFYLNMAEIKPNDIGLATFADVSDVANLRTNAKEVVVVINEVLANSSGHHSECDEQLYGRCEDNTVIGSGNIYIGNGNQWFWYR